MSFDGFPFIIGWELTLACNLRCRHCGSSAGFPRKNELTTKEALALCDQFPALLVREVDFTGGEPLLRSDWPILASHLASKRIPTKILTNGLAVNLQTAKQMKDVGISGVGFSLDGMEKTHDDIRGRRGTFRKVLHGIDIIRHEDIPVTVITTVNDLNVEELSTLLNLLRVSGVKNWQIQPLFPLGRGRGQEDLILSEKAYFQMGAFVRDVGTGTKSDPEIETADSYGYFTEFDICSLPWKGCPGGILSCGITSDGRVKGCLSMPDHLVEGDLRHNDLWDIWFHPNSFSFTRLFSPLLLGQNCQSCPKAQECGGGCTTMSYGYTGVFHNDPFCFYGMKKRLSQKNSTNPE